MNQVTVLPDVPDAARRRVIVVPQMCFQKDEPGGNENWFHLIHLIHVLQELNWSLRTTPLNEHFIRCVKAGAARPTNRELNAVARQLPPPAEVAAILLASPPPLVEDIFRTFSRNMAVIAKICGSAPPETPAACDPLAPLRRRARYVEE